MTITEQQLEELTFEEYNKGVKEGKMHSEPSPQTINFLKNMDSKICKIEDKLSDISIEIAKIPELMSDRFDKRYASKYTETAIKWFIALVLTAVLGAIITPIFRDKSVTDKEIKDVVLNILKDNPLNK